MDYHNYFSPGIPLHLDRGPSESTRLQIRIDVVGNDNSKIRGEGYSLPRVPIEEMDPGPRFEIASPPSSSQFLPLTMPQFPPVVHPRPEFICFEVPYLCNSHPYDHKGFWSFPQRQGWEYRKELGCHVLCPPRTCHHGMTATDILRERPVAPTPPPV